MRYSVERLMAPARDGVLVPVSIVYRKPFVRNGERPLLEYAYGSYGYSIEPTFSSTRISLLDRGIVYAIAHVRGGQEMGRHWYDAGKMKQKMNTFHDFIDVAEFLVRERYTSTDRLAAHGGSAGGLLMGVIANLRPDLFEVIVADDGSGADTRTLLHEIARDYPTALRHVWQEHRGFRVGEARNRAVAAARGDYVIFLDGDMLPQADFVADHLAAARPRCFTQGMRALAGPELTERLLATRTIDVAPFARGLGARRNAWRLSVANLLRRPRAFGRKLPMSCNQGFWRDDLLCVNGFDERMSGWGREDTELALRCYRAGIRRLQLRYAAIAVHLHHRPRGDGNAATPNDSYLAESELSGRVRCELGIDRHLTEFTAPPSDLRAAAERPACA